MWPPSQVLPRIPSVPTTPVSPDGWDPAPLAVPGAREPKDTDPLAEHGVCGEVYELLLRLGFASKKKKKKQSDFHWDL